MTHSTRVAPTDRMWNDALKESLPTIGTKAREAAQKWATQAAAILGIIAITTIFKGKETLDALEVGRRDLVLNLVGLALFLGFVGLLTAAIAGRPQFKKDWTTPDRIRDQQHKEVEDAGRWTLASMVAVSLAFLVTLWVASLIWTSPKPTSPPSNTLVVGASGARACGELKVQPDGRLLAGTSELPADPVLFVEVEKCP